MRRFVYFDSDGIFNLDAITHIQKYPDDTAIIVFFGGGASVTMYDWTLEDILKVLWEERDES